MEYLTIIFRARMGSKSLAHEAEGRMGYWLIAHESPWEPRAQSPTVNGSLLEWFLTYTGGAIISREYLKGECIGLHVRYIYCSSFHGMSRQQFDMRKRNHIQCYKDCRVRLYLYSVSSDSKYARLWQFPVIFFKQSAEYIWTTKEACKFITTYQH